MSLHGVCFTSTSGKGCSGLTEERIEKIVNNCAANQLFEGLICTEEDKEAARRILRGETTADEEVAAVIAKYKEKRHGYECEE